jgi:folate-binding protein YgfZ
VHGPDAEPYLQSQVSQDLTGLEPGASRWAFLLAPDGKVDLLVRVLRTDEDAFMLDVDAGCADALAARLRRFLIRTKAEVSATPWTCLAVRGPDAAAAEAGAGSWKLVSWWGNADAVDLLGAELAPPSGARDVGAAELEAARVAAGWPAMGREIRPGETIPAETGLVDVAVSLTKGCYPGQELVERMHARGAQAPRSLRRLQAESRLREGADVVHDGRAVGTVTSAAGPLGLAPLARAVRPGDAVDVDGTPATVHDLRPG